MSAHVTAPSASGKEIDYPRLGLISLGHLTNDVYGGTITSLMPYLVLAGQISTSAAGFVLLSYLLGSSVMQPIFGLYSDQSGTRLYAVGGPLLVGLSAGLVGWVNNSLMLLLVVAVGGVGTAAFHPQAASMVNKLSKRNKGWAMSIFSMGGNIGFACGPLAAATIAMIGLHWGIVLMLPGLVVCVLMARYSPTPGGVSERIDLKAIRDEVLRAWRPLSLIVTVIATRSAVQFAFIIFLPLYYHSRGFPAELGSYYAFVLSIAGAAGGLIGGRLSDSYGRKRIVTSSLLVCGPLLLLALLAPPLLVWPLIALAGAFLIASNSVSVVQGQEWLPANTGIASGLTLGIGFGLSGVIASVLSTAAQHFGVDTVLYLVPLLAWLAAGLAALVRDAPALSGSSPRVDGGKRGRATAAGQG
jgi:FSR family fosmidomycin resistance protein-like MFS transporter